jgi:hypothetical protein
LSTRGTLLAAVATLAAGTALPAEPAPEVDAELLEFLGSLDTEDEEWREYLAERPIRPEAGKPEVKDAAKEQAGKKPDDKVKKP